MTLWNILVMAGYAAGAFLAFRHSRALLWLAAGALAYLVSVAYWRSGLPHAEVVTGLVDAAICVAIFMRCREEWELWVWMAFQASLLVSIMFLVNNIYDMKFMDDMGYTVVLEALNFAVIAIIGGSCAWQDAGYSNARAFRPRRSIFGVVLPFYRSAASDK